MKKLLTMSALLLVALLLFTSCPSEPDPNALPGTWAPSVEMNTTTRNLFDGHGSLTYQSSSKSFVYTLEHPDQLTDKPDEGEFTYYPIPLTSDDTYTGFKATVSGTPSPNVGFIINFTRNSSTGKDTYYTILLHDGSYRIRKTINDVTTEVTDWTPDDAINEESEGNEVLVYKDGTSLIIQVNGVTVHRIESPAITFGKCGVICAVSGAECVSSETVTATYKFTNFQIKR